MRARSATVIGTLTATLLISGCNKESNSTATTSAPAVDVVSVVLQQVKSLDSFNGRVSPMDDVTILPRVGGYITRVAYKEGDEVSKGDLLFVVDQRPYRAALESERAKLEGARAALVFAKQQDQRAQQMLRTNAVSKEEAEQKRAIYEQSLAEVHAAQSALDTAALNLEFTEIRSPISGRTGHAQLTVGNLAIADQTVLTSVVSQDPVYVYFDPDEQSFLKYQKSLQTPRDARVQIGIGTDERWLYEGALTFVDNQVNSPTGTIRARATVRNPQRTLIPGLYAKVRLAIGEPAQAILVPDRAILTDQDKKYVYTLSADNTAQKRYVETGQLMGRKRVVTAGLAQGDQVVISGLQQIYSSGMPVSPNELPSENTALEVSDAVHSRNK